MKTATITTNTDRFGRSWYVARMEDKSIVWLGTNKQDARRKMRRMSDVAFSDPFGLFSRKEAA
jgi:hypothetical protein